MLDPVQCREYEQIRSSCEKGDEFPRRLCDRLSPVTAILYYRWSTAGLYDKIISQGVGGRSQSLRGNSSPLWKPVQPDAVYTAPEKFENAIFLQLGSRFSVDGKHFENGALRKRCSS